MQTRYSLVLAALCAMFACQAKPDAATETVAPDPEPDEPAAAHLVPERPAVIEQTAGLTAAASSDAPQPKAVVDPAPSKPSAEASAEVKVASAPAADAVTIKPQPSPKLPARTEKAIAPAPEVKGKSCDIKQVDWKNFDYGEVKLQNGTEATGGAEYDDGYMSKLSEVHYADLDGDKALEALVLVECPRGGPGMSSLGSLHGYKLDASCVPRSVGVLDANGYGGGKVNGRKFIFERNETTMSGPDGPSMESWRVECVMRGGKLVEKVTPL